MSHTPEVRERVRTAYIYKRLSLEVAASSQGVGLPTAQSWKARAKKKGDDWDVARAAVSLSSDNKDEMAVLMLNDFILMFRNTQDLLRTATDITTLQKVQAIASLSDSFAKSMKCFERLMPQLNQAVMANTLLTQLATFIAAEFPQHLGAFADILEPFARTLGEEKA